MTSPIVVRAVGTRLVRASRGASLAYELETHRAKPASGSKETLIWRRFVTEAELKSFDAHLKSELAKHAKLAQDGSRTSVEFPLKEFKTGLEILPGLVLVATLGSGVYVYEMDPESAVMLALVLASSAMVLVMAIGMLGLPLTWSGAKRLGPVETYLNQAVAALVATLQSADEAVTVASSLLEPPQRPDWPGRVGPIDLDVQDLPHDSAATEWWYYHAYFGSISVFASFFRVVKYVDPKTGVKYHGHALTWAVSDSENQTYSGDVILEKDSPEILLKAIEMGIAHGPNDPYINRALLDIFRKGSLPAPDRMMSKDPVVATHVLSMNLDGNTLRKTDKGDYVLSLKNDKGMEMNLSFKPRKAATRHGDHGVVKGHEGKDEDMYYYFISRCEAKATLKMGHDAPVRDLGVGSGWFDHEFGGVPKPAKEVDDSDIKSNPQQIQASYANMRNRDRMEYAWNWVAVQLADDVELTAALLIDPRLRCTMEVKVVVVHKDGRRDQFDETSGSCLTEIPGHTWTSMRTFRTYPTKFRLVVPPLGIDLVLEATFPDQEFMTLLSKPAFWEGRCSVQGTGVHGKPVTGNAYLERNGFDPDSNIKSFFKSVGVAVRQSVEKCYPLNPTQEEVVTLIATEKTAHYADDVPADVLAQTLIAPIRLITDRGGKSWRSYAALACVDAVGGDSRKYIQWLSMPELLHVGSLVVDDIEDKSESRRGGPCSHLVYGEPLAINAGTACYFECQNQLNVPGMTDDVRLKCYDLFFAALRGGHAGQALDIHGLDYMIPAVVESGDSALAEKRLEAIHRLKTAVPAATLAKLGATVGGGSEEQIEAIGEFFLAIGIAFQIIDDVVNLRGQYAEAGVDKNAGAALKTRGEDIMCGKFTFPVLKALGRMREVSDRRAFADAIAAKPQSQTEVDELIERIERLGALDACVTHAAQIVEDSWLKVDRVIPDSFAKMMLRSFGWVISGTGG